MGNRNTTESRNEKYSDSGILELHNLPTDVLLQLLTYLDLTSLVSMARTCRLLRDLAYNSRFWKKQVINLSAEPLWIAESLVCDSLVTRKLETLKVVEAFSHPTKRITMDVRYIDQTNNQMPRLLNSKQT